MPRFSYKLWSRVFSFAVGLAALFVAEDGGAFERQWHVGGRAGVASLSGRGLGPALGVHSAYGLSDMFDIVAEGLASRHGGSAGTDVLSGAVGLSYKIDVFEWIPYIGLLGGYYRYEGRPGPDGEQGGVFGGAFQAGVDYLLVRHWALGMDLRWHAAFRDGMQMPLFSATLGAEYRWGF